MSSTARALGVALSARRRIAWRRLKERAFELFVLGPLIIGAAAWVGERYLYLVRPIVAEWLDASAGPVALPSLVLGVALTPLLWPGALRELYGQRPLDFLPVPEIARFGMTLLSRAVGALAPSAVLLSALWVVEGRPPSSAEAAWVIGGVAVVAWLAVALAGGLVRWGAASTAKLLALLGAAAFIVFGPIPGLRWALAPWGLAGSAVHRGLGAHGDFQPSAALGPASAALVALAAVAWVHLRWRRRDLERVQPQAVTSRPFFARWRLPVALPGGLERRLDDRFPGPLRALLRRDLLLIYRRFGPAAHLTAALAVAWIAVAAGLALDRALPIEDVWRLRLMVGASTLAVLSTVAAVPFLLHRQLPVFWLEKATGVPLEQVWLAKVCLAAILALPGLASGLLLITLAGPGTAVERAVAVAQLALTSLVVSTLIGLACFEIATEPLIGTLWSGMVAVALASLFVLYPNGWWLWLLAYGWAAGEVGKRASRRVKFTEVAT